ncbi:glucarate transporter [Escherichia coli]|nr:glucarate transporter [Escherichia coli]
MGLCYRADPWWLVAGSFWFKTRLLLVDLYLVDVYLAARLRRYLSGFGIIVALFTLRFLVGLAEAPSFPGNSRIVAAWFPAQERGTAVSIFNSAQYFATVIFAPIMGWLTHEVAGHTSSSLWRSGDCHQLYLVESHPRAKSTSGVNQKELEYIAAGGALINMDQQNTKVKVPFSVKWGQIKQLLGSRI